MKSYRTFGKMARIDAGTGGGALRCGTTVLGFVAALTIAAESSASGGPCDPVWDTACIGDVAGHAVWTATLFDDGTGEALYVGGQFEQIDGVHSPRLARFNGTTWSDVGGGLHGDGFSLVSPWHLGILTMTVFDDGTGPALYVGGNFQNAAGVGANGIARWDGVQWSALGKGLDASAFALHVHDDGSGPALYVGGEFTEAGGLPASNIARWDGKHWSTVGGGIDPGYHPAHVIDFATFNDLLIVGGHFYRAGSHQALGHIVAWDGEDWLDMDGVQTDEGEPAFGWIETLHVHDDGSGPALYAGGAFFIIGGAESASIAKWDGQSWSSVGTGTESPLFPYLGVVRTLVSFDGGSGTPMLYACGFFSHVGGTLAHHIARWDGSNWTSLGEGIGGTLGFSAVGPYTMIPWHDGNGHPALYLGGYMHTAGGHPVQNLARLLSCTNR